MNSTFWDRCVLVVKVILFIPFWIFGFLTYLPWIFFGWLFTGRMFRPLIPKYVQDILDELQDGYQ